MIGKSQLNVAKTVGVIYLVMWLLLIPAGFYKGRVNREHYERAKTYMSIGKYDEALKEFEESHYYSDSKQLVTECYVLQGYDVCPECGCKLESRRNNGN